MTSKYVPFPLLLENFPSQQAGSLLLASLRRNINSFPPPYLRQEFSFQLDHRCLPSNRVSSLINRFTLNIFRKSHLQKHSGLGTSKVRTKGQNPFKMCFLKWKEWTLFLFVIQMSNWVQVYSRSPLKMILVYPSASDGLDYRPLQGILSHKDL